MVIPQRAGVLSSIWGVWRVAKLTIPPPVLPAITPTVPPPPATPNSLQVSPAMYNFSGHARGHFTALPPKGVQPLDNNMLLKSVRKKAHVLLRRFLLAAGRIGPIIEYMARRPARDSATSYKKGEYIHVQTHKPRAAMTWTGAR